MWYIITLAGGVSFLLGLVVGWLIAQEVMEVREVNKYEAENEENELSQR